MCVRLCLGATGTFVKHIPFIPINFRQTKRTYRELMCHWFTAIIRIAPRDANKTLTHKTICHKKYQMVFLSIVFTIRDSIVTQLVNSIKYPMKLYLQVCQSSKIISAPSHRQNHHKMIEMWKMEISHITRRLLCWHHWAWLIFTKFFPRHFHAIYH